MSNNTNTLFWVITGAVIVLGVFLLVNLTKEDGVEKINTTFSNMVDANGNINEEYINSIKTNNSSNSQNNNIPNDLFETEEEILDHEEYLKLSTMDYCRKPTISLRRFSVKHISTTEDTLVVDITNNANLALLNVSTVGRLFTCDGHVGFSSCHFTHPRIDPGVTVRYTCSISNNNPDLDISRFYMTFW